jgi:hypothetical protein
VPVGVPGPTAVQCGGYTVGGEPRGLNVARHECGDKPSKICAMQEHRQPHCELTELGRARKAAQDVCARPVSPQREDRTLLGNSVRLEIDSRGIPAATKQKTGTTGRVGGDGLEPALVHEAGKTKPPPDDGLTFL